MCLILVVGVTLFVGYRGQLEKNKSFSSKEKQKWVIRGKKTKAKGNNRKRPSAVQRKNED